MYLDLVRSPYLTSYLFRNMRVYCCERRQSQALTTAHSAPRALHIWLAIFTFFDQWLWLSPLFRNAKESFTYHIIYQMIEKRGISFQTRKKKLKKKLVNFAFSFDSKSHFVL